MNLAAKIIIKPTFCWSIITNNLFCKVEVAKQEIRRKVRGYRLKEGKQKEPPLWMALLVLLYKELFLVGPVGAKHAEI